MKKLLLISSYLALAACASTGNVDQLKLKKDVVKNYSTNSKAQKGIAIRYPVGLTKSSDPSATTADLFKEFNNALEVNRYSIGGTFSKKKRTIMGTPDIIENDMDSRNFSISSALAKTQLFAHSVFANIKNDYPNANVYLNPVLINLSPGDNVDEKFCQNWKKVSFEESALWGTTTAKEIEGYSFCYQLLDGSDQSNPPPPAAVIDTFVFNNPNLVSYYQMKDRSMGLEVAPGMMIGVFNEERFLSDPTTNNFHNYYVGVDGMQRSVGEGDPFKCMFVRCKKKPGSIEVDVLSLTQDDLSFDWETLKRKTKDVSLFAYSKASDLAEMESHLNALYRSGFSNMPAVQVFEKNAQIANTALNVEYLFLEKNSEKLHENFLNQGVPMISNVIELETPILKELLKETKKANAKSMIGGIIGMAAGSAIGMNGGSAFTQSMVTNNFLDSVQKSTLASLQKNAFKLSEDLVYSQSYVSDINLDYRDELFSIGNVSSMEDLRAKVSTKLNQSVD